MEYNKKKNQGLPGKLLFLEMPGTSTGGFLDPVVDHFKKIVDVSYVKTSNPRRVEQAVHEADMVWLEWANQMAVHATCNLSELHRKKVICRLHGYEIFTRHPQRINWQVVDSLVFVANHKRELFNEIVDLHSCPQQVIRNGIDTDKFSVPVNKKNRKSLVLLGNLNFRKGLPILLQFFNELLKKDGEYRLFIRGKFQDPLLEMATRTMIGELSLGERIEFVDYVSNLDEWLADKSHILSFSLEESFHFALGEGMAAGLKPVIHAWRESREIWPNQFIFNDLNGFLDIMLDDGYEPARYRDLIFKHRLDLHHQLLAIESLVRQVNQKEKLDQKRIQRRQIKNPAFISAPQKDASILSTSHGEAGGAVDGKKGVIYRYLRAWDALSPYPTVEMQDKLYQSITGMSLSAIKCERLDQKYNLWETDMVIEDPHKGLVLHTLIYDYTENQICAPFSMPSHLKDALAKHARRCIEQPGIKRGESILCRIYDKKLLKKVAANHEAFVWERLYPGTIFTPLNLFLDHMRLYEFAGRFIKPSDKVVDVACGLGYGTKYLSRFCSTVVGIDQSLESLNFATKFYNGDHIKWLGGDVGNLSLMENTIDAFIAMEMFERLDDQKRMLAEVKRVLKPSGVAIFSIPNSCSYKRKKVNIPIHKHEFSYVELAAMISQFFESWEVYGLSPSGEATRVEFKNANHAAISFWVVRHE